VGGRKFMTICKFCDSRVISLSYPSGLGASKQFQLCRGKASACTVHDHGTTDVKLQRSM